MIKKEFSLYVDLFDLLLRHSFKTYTTIKHNSADILLPNWIRWCRHVFSYRMYRM